MTTTPVFLARQFGRRPWSTRARHHARRRSQGWSSPRSPPTLRWRRSATSARASPRAGSHSSRRRPSARSPRQNSRKRGQPSGCRPARPRASARRGRRCKRCRSGGRPCPATSVHNACRTGARRAAAPRAARHLHCRSYTPRSACSLAPDRSGRRHRGCRCRCRWRRRAPKRFLGGQRNPKSSRSVRSSRPHSRCRVRPPNRRGARATTPPVRSRGRPSLPGAA
mmetsp:Transcript_73700/g.240040  ORF Transcript_73700/g.240040 Transcript_73700/m.240040 type:complete len:224 (-) Transcript_73700:440-1111(-)